jgi:biotin carboxylase
MHVGRQEGVLLQECVEGVSVGLEACFFRGKLIRACVMDDQFAPEFVSPLGHSLPSRLPVATQHRIVHDAERAASALQLEDGPANFDLRLRDDETVIIEVNPRLGGNSISELVQMAYGVDLCRAAVLVALGSDPTGVLAPSANRSAAARLLISPHRGKVSFSGELPKGFRAFCEHGANTRQHVDQQAILGRAICEASTPDEAPNRAKAICDSAAEKILVEPQA